MFRSKLFWGFVLGIITSGLLFEAQANLAYAPVGTRIFHVLASPGTHFVAALSAPGSLIASWTRSLAVLGFACNLLVYVFFWYVCISMISYFRGRRHPYDRESTLVPPSLR
jgi:hypothetical protein